MKISIPYNYTEDWIPPRCRKPRPRELSATSKLTIHEVTGTEAPIAIVKHGRNFDDGDLCQVDTVYRWWRGHLWVRDSFSRASGAPLETQTASQFQADPYPYNLKQPRDSYYCGSRSRRDRINQLRRWAASILLIDGQRWAAENEPRYVIMTFGLGCNHGLGWGTSLSSDNSYNSNIGRDRYYRIDQFEQAVAETTRVALARGDTKAVPVLEKQNPDRFDILIPEAVRLNPGKEHGKGDSFMNQAEALIEGVKDPLAAGFGLMALALR